MELPKKAGAGEAWGVSVSSPSPKEVDLPSVRGSPGPLPSDLPASETPDGQPKPGRYQSEGAARGWEGQCSRAARCPSFRVTSGPLGPIFLILANEGDRASLLEDSILGNAKGQAKR